jgi:hypothetical protein
VSPQVAGCLWGSQVLPRMLSAWGLARRHQVGGWLLTPGPGRPRVGLFLTFVSSLTESLGSGKKSHIYKCHCQRHLAQTHVPFVNAEGENREHPEYCSITQTITHSSGLSTKEGPHGTRSGHRTFFRTLRAIVHPWVPLTPTCKTSWALRKCLYTHNCMRRVFISQMCLQNA